MDSATAPPGLENGHSSAPGNALFPLTFLFLGRTVVKCYCVFVLCSYVHTESLVITREVKSDLSDQPQEQVAPVAMVMPHLPITATTKIAESSIAIVAKTLDPPSSPIQAPPPVVTGSPPDQSTAIGTQVQPIPEFLHQSGEGISN